MLKCSSVARVLQRNKSLFKSCELCWSFIKPGREKNGFNFLNQLKTFWKYELSNGIFVNILLKAFFSKGNALNEDKYFQNPGLHTSVKIFRVFSARVTSADINSKPSSASRLLSGYDHFSTMNVTR